jgi:hypothetical protein
MSDTRVKAVRDALLNYGVGVKSMPGFPRRHALIECIQAVSYPKHQHEGSTEVGVPNLAEAERRVFH